MKTKLPLLAAALAGALACITTNARAADPLPSWHAAAPKNAIVGFGERVTKPGSPDFGPGRTPPGFKI